LSIRKRKKKNRVATMMKRESRLFEKEISRLMKEEAA
jgi:hypothetical protein